MSFQGKQGYGLDIKLRTATGNDAVFASLTNGAGDSNLVFQAKEAGADGNNITITMVNPGSTSDTSVSVSGTDISVTLGYSGGSVDASANEVIAAVYSSAAAAALIDVNNGSGDGTGTVSPLSQTSLTSGVDATHSFETIEGVGDVTLPGENRELLDLTNHASPDGRAEFIKSAIKEGSDFSITLFWDKENAIHQALQAAESSDGATKMQFFEPKDLSGYESDVLVLNIENEYPVRGIITATVSLRTTGARTAVTRASS